MAALAASFNFSKTFLLMMGQCMAMMYVIIVALKKDVLSHCFPSLILVAGLIGLADNPGDEELGLLPRLGQKFERDHIQHLDRLVQFGV